MTAKLEIRLAWARYALLIYTGPCKGDRLMKANAALLNWGAQPGIVWNTSQTEHGDDFAHVSKHASEIQETNRARQNGKPGLPSA